MKKVFASLFISFFVFSGVLANTITITNQNDGLPGSLRDAITTATSGDTLVFSSSLNGITQQVLFGEIAITKNLVIIGNDTTNTFVTGSAFGIFTVNSGVTVYVSGIKFSGGTATEGGGIKNQGTLVLRECSVSNCTASTGGAIYNNGILNIEKTMIYSNSANSESENKGGAIYNHTSGNLTIDSSEVYSNTGWESCTENQGSLTISHSKFHHNTTTHGGGGGISNFGSLYITFSEFYNNSAEYEGGGIMSIDSPPAFEISDSKVFSNSGKDAGGGIYADGHIKAERLKIQGNTLVSGDGGGLFVQNLSSGQYIRNSLITGNYCESAGGGVYVAADLEMTNCTVVSNKSFTPGGGIYSNNSGTLVMKNNVVAENFADVIRSDIYATGSITNQDYNALSVNSDVNSTFPAGTLVGTGASPVDFFFLNAPELQTVADTSGNFNFLGSSPLIGAGDATGITDTLDVNSDARVVGTIDIGAIESSYLTQTVYSATAVEPPCSDPSNGQIAILGFEATYTDFEFTMDGSIWQDDTIFSTVAIGFYPVKFRAKSNIGVEYSLGTVEISNYTIPYAQVIFSNGTCADNDGFILFSQVIGNAPLEFSLDSLNWQDDSLFTGLSAGSYGLYMREKNDPNCVTPLGSDFVAEYTPLFVTAPFVQDVNCTTPQSGKITVAAPSGGSGNYEFSKDGGSTWQIGQFTVSLSEDTTYGGGITFDSLAAGAYNLAFRDKDNTTCIYNIGSFDVNLESGPAFNTSIVNPECTTGQKGQFSFSMTDSDLYEYSIDNGLSWQNDSVFIDLIHEQINPVIRLKTVLTCKVNGTEITMEPQGSMITFATLQNIDCAGNDGQISLGIPVGGFSGQPSYSLDGVNFQSSGVFPISASGDYTAYVRDEQNMACETEVGTFTISQESTPDISALVDFKHAFCDAAGAEVSFHAPAGFTSTITYGLKRNSQSFSWSTDPVFDNLTAGTYVVAVLDSNVANCPVYLDTLSIQFSSSLSDIFVDSAATGANDGSSWTDAFTSFQDALDKAAACGVSQIWVAKGTYYPEYFEPYSGQNFEGRNREFKFDATSNLNIYASLQSGTTDYTSSDPNLYPTILSADVQQNTGTGDNSFRLLHFGGNSEILLQGLIFTDANGLDSTGHDYQGNLFFENDVVDMVKCQVKSFNNKHRGSIINYTGQNFSMDKCKIFGNATQTNHLIDLSNSEPTFDFNQCVVSGNNISSGSILKISNSISATLNIRNCTVANNLFGSGLSLVQNFPFAGVQKIYNSIFWGNDNGDINPAIFTFFNNSDFTNSLIQGLNLSNNDNFDGTDPANDPVFINPVTAEENPMIDGNYALASCSPLLNAGYTHNTYYPEIGDFDIDGNNRYNTTIDLGAYESVYSVFEADWLAGLDCDYKAFMLGIDAYGGSGEYEYSITTNTTPAYADTNRVYATDAAVYYLTVRDKNQPVCVLDLGSQNLTTKTYAGISQFLSISDDIQSSGTEKAWLKLDANTTISNSVNVNFEASRSIELNPGFEVESGNVFKADIVDCGYLD